MTILHVANGRLYGGIERMLATLAESAGLLRQVAFEFAVCADGRLAGELQERGAVVHALGDVRLSRPASVLRARAAVRALLRTRRYGAVVCHAPWAYAIFGGVARSCGVRAILWQHDRATGATLVERAARAIPADLVICNSLWTAASAPRLQPRAPVQVVRCAVPFAPAVGAAARQDIRAALGADRADVVVLAASRIEPWKGQSALIRALAGLPNRGWKLWIAGGAQRPHEQQYAAALAAEVASLGLGDRVRFLGERRDVRALLGAADVLAQANAEPEPFGIIFAEALLAGVPVVTTAMGGAPEIVDSSCGRLVPPGDADALRAALDALLADPALRATLGAAGPAHAAARCDPAVVLPFLEQTLLAHAGSAAA